MASRLFPLNAKRTDFQRGRNALSSGDYDQQTIREIKTTADVIYIGYILIAHSALLNKEFYCLIRNKEYDSLGTRTVNLKGIQDTQFVSS